MGEHFIQSSWAKQDTVFEAPLRPQSLRDFFGQESLQERLGIFLGAAKKRNEPIGHCLLSGPPGLGKTTLAHIIAKTMGTNIVVTSGPVIEKGADLAGILTNLQPGDILFIDEIHRLSKAVEEYLYPAMEDFTLDLLIDSGPNSRTVQVKLNHFTLIGATTRTGLLSSPLRSRFQFMGRLEYYNAATLQQIIQRSAELLRSTIDRASSFIIAERSRGTPRIANNLLKWVRDFTEMKGETKISEKLALAALEMLSIDHKGLDEMDKKILSVMIDHYHGGPVGIQTLGVAVGEEADTLEEVYEPYLILNGFLKRTPRGRELTDAAYAHLGRKRKNNGKANENI
ncbi:MAG: Holliday junction branch migration DNA helicase RuvB [Chlamydiota bacterium]